MLTPFYCPRWSGPESFPASWINSWTGRQRTLTRGSSFSRHVFCLQSALSSCISFFADCFALKGHRGLPASPQGRTSAPWRPLVFCLLAFQSFFFCCFFYSFMSRGDAMAVDFESLYNLLVHLDLFTYSTRKLCTVYYWMLIRLLPKLYELYCNL